MKRGGIILTIILSILALVVGFGGTTSALLVTQPASSGSTIIVDFEVNSGESFTSVAQRLQEDGLIRNATAFKLLAKLRKKDTSLEAGVYQLSPSMTMSAIMDKLQQSTPDFVLAGPPDGLRVTQYAQYFTNVSGFNADNFLKIVKDGVFTDTNQPVSTEYWYVLPKGKNVAYALEGYLYPDKYAFEKGDDENTVVRRMLNELGEKLCPGPSNNPDAYIKDPVQCRANAVTVGNNVNIFDAMDATYFTKNDAVALYDTLTIASLAAREISNFDDAIGVASTYYNRLLDHLGKVPGDTGGYMGSDPSAEYARDTDNPPTDGKWWQALADSGSKTDPNNPYNTENINDATHAGLPPGPIAAPLWQEIVAAAAPKDFQQWPYFYFVSDKCGKIHYYKNATDFGNNEVADSNMGC